MQKTRSAHSRRLLILAGMMLGLMLLTSACGGDPHTQQQASQNKAQLDQQLSHAQAIGVPAALLKPIIKQEQQLSSSSAPFTVFNDQPATDYYHNLATRYQQLFVQTQGLIMSVTEQFQAQAEHDMQLFDTALTQRRSQNIGDIQAFTEQYSQDQALLAAAQYPKDYALISSNAQKSIAALDLLGQTYTQLNAFKNTFSQMKAAHIDVTAMQTQYQNDLQVFNNASTVLAFQNLDTLLNVQYQQAVVSSIQAIPYVSAAKLGEFQAQINLLKTYGMDATAYQQRYNADAAAIKKAKTLHNFLVVSLQIDADIASMHNDLTQGASTYLVGKLDRDATAWGQAHYYHDTFNGQNYILDAGYTMNGIGYWLNRELGWTWTPDGYQAVVDEENNQFFNLQMLEQDYSDPTPYNQIHATDLLMLNHYGLQHTQVLMISFVEQTMRVYQDGKLVRAFHVTTGRVERPALPGAWTVQNRQSPTAFKSTDPPGSPYWYPDTPIKYAILYHWGGFFVHDAWWRVNFGPGTQFPHYDVGGDESFAGNGSHGCVNLQSNDAAWVYANTDWNTQIVLY